jgi:hypothetical protein
MLLTAYGIAVEALEAAHHQPTTVKKAARGLGALAVTALALRFTDLLVARTRLDAGCMQANREDSGCKQHGGE